MNPFSQAQQAQPETEQILKPPPIFINNVTNFTLLCTALTEIVGKDSKKTGST
jgi:hypothetical protein